MEITNREWLTSLGYEAPSELKYDDIEAWCVANDKVDWLLAEFAKTTTIKEYPRKTIEKTNPNTGKTRKVSVADRDAEPTTKTINYTFPMVRANFIKEFMSDLLETEPKDKEPTIADKLAALKAKMGK